MDVLATVIDEIIGGSWRLENFSGKVDTRFPRQRARRDTIPGDAENAAIEV
jgi:hypothetical protein